MMLDLHRLRLLRHLQTRGTIAAVAEALSYSPSTVSHQLAMLQREAGIVLFERDGRRLRLTEAAHMLARHAEALEAQMERAEADMAAAAGTVAGVVRIAAFQTAATNLVAPALADLAHDHPSLRAELVETESDRALAAMRRRECDLAICEVQALRHPPRNRGLSIESLHVEQVRLITPRQCRASRVTELADAPWAAGPSGTSHERLVMEVCAEEGFEPDIRHRARDLLVLLALVDSGQAVTLLPDMAHSHRKCEANAYDVGVRRRIVSAIRNDSLSRPSLAALRAALRRAAQRLTRTP